MTRNGASNAALLLALALLSGCKPGHSGSSSSDTSDVDDQPLLAQTHLFDQSVVQTVSLADAVHQDEPAFVVSLLVKSGSLSVEGTTSGSPWWQYAVKDANVTRQGDVVTFEVGAPKISEKSEVRDWKDGAVEHFAETVSYTVQASSAISAVSQNQLGPYKIRLVWTNDPRVGHWQLDDSTGPANARSQIEAGLEAAGQPYLPHLRAQIGRAQQDAYEQLKNQITAQTGMEVGPSPNLVINKRLQAAYYFPPDRFNDHRLGDFDAACRNVKLSVGHNWRWVTRNDLNPILNQRGNLIDTPVHAFWPGLSNANATIPVNTFHVPNGFATLQDLATIEPKDTFYWQDTLNLYDNGNGSFTSSTPPSRNTSDSKEGSSFDIRILCIGRL